MELTTVLIFTSFIKLSVAVCSFPNASLYRQWNMLDLDENQTTDSSKLTFFNSSYLLNLKYNGKIYSSSVCFLQNETIYVMRSYNSKNDLKVIICAQFSRLDDNMFYVTFLADQLVSGVDMKITEDKLSNDNTISACAYCNYTSTPRTFLLKRVDYDITTVMEKPTFCNPCLRPCHVSSSAEIKEEPKDQTFIIGIVIGIFCIGGFFIGLCLYVAQQRKQKREAKSTDEEPELKRLECDQAGPIEDFKDIPSGEILVEKIDV